MEISFTPQDREILTDLSDAIRTMHQSHSIPDVLISNKEAARYLGVSYATISHWIKNGKLERCSRDGAQGVMLHEVMRIKRNPQ